MQHEQSLGALVRGSITRPAKVRRRPRAGHDRAIGDQQRAGRAHDESAPGPGMDFGRDPVRGREDHRPVGGAVDQNGAAVGDVDAGVEPHDGPFLNRQHGRRRNRQIPRHMDACVRRPDRAARQRARHGCPSRVGVDVDLLVRLESREGRVEIHEAAVRGRGQETVTVAAQNPKGARLITGRAHPAIDPARVAGVVLDPRNDRNLQPGRIILGRDQLQPCPGHLRRRGRNGRQRHPLDQSALRAAALG